MAHETLDRRAPRPIGIMHPRRDFGLNVERQPILASPREDVEMAAHRPQKIFGPAETAQLLRGQQSLVDQFADAADARNNPPKKGRKIAGTLFLLIAAAAGFAWLRGKA